MCHVGIQLAGAPASESARDTRCRGGCRAVTPLDKKSSLEIKIEQAMLVHTAFDLLGWLTAALVGVLIGRLHLLGVAPKRSPFTDPGYFIALGLGALSGAI